MPHKRVDVWNRPETGRLVEKWRHYRRNDLAGSDWANADRAGWGNRAGYRGGAAMDAAAVGAVEVGAAGEGEV